MEREDLLNALRLVRDYCKGLESCSKCCIKKECKYNIRELPEDWKIENV